MSSFLDVPFVPGTVQYQQVPIAEFSDGSPVLLPVVTATGVEDGPVTYVQAGIHGDELTGIDICRRFITSLDPTEVRGRIVVVPVANVPAYLTRTRGFLHEERWLIDINRIFPGNSNGLLTERIADILFNQFVAASDFSVDLHSALEGCDIAPFVYIDPDDDEAGTLDARVKAGRAFGTPYIYYKSGQSKLGTSDMSRSLSAVADRNRIAKITAEMGESRRVSGEVVSMGVQGVRNVMHVVGTLAGDPSPVDEPLRFTEIRLIHCSRGGGLRMSVDLHDRVTEGQTVAEVVDVFGRVVETMVSPIDGIVLRAMRLGSVSTGAEVAWVVR